MKSELNRIYLSERLQKKLDQILLYPLTTVVSPAGYGKTTAIRAFRDELGREAAIMQQSIFSDSVIEFWYDFSEMLGTLLSPEETLSLHKMGLPVDGTTQREFLRFLQKITYKAQKDVVMIIDDCHLINDPSFYEFILFAGRSLPERTHMVLLSRTPALRVWAKLLFSGKVNEITERELCFDLEDVKTYFSQCGYPLSDEAADRLSAASEGWVAVLYLNLVSYAETGRFLNEGDIHTMMETILYDPLPEDQRELLTAVSLLPVFTPELAVEISQRQDAPKMLEEMAQCNAFIKCSGGEYRLHHLLQENLQRAFKKMPEAYRRGCLTRAGHWYLNNGDTVMAARMCYAGGDYEGVMRAVENSLGATLSADHKEEMLQWFGNCPEEILNAHPVAMLVYARRLFTFNMRQPCTEMLDRMMHLLREDQNLSVSEKRNLFGEIEIVRSFLDYNNISAMSVHHRRACELMDRPTTAVAPTAVWGYGSPSVLTSYYRETGTLDREIDVMKEAMPYWYQLNPRQGSGAEHIFEGEACFLRGKTTDADICLNRGLYDAQRDNQLIMIFAAHFLRLRIEAFQGDLSNAAPTLQMLRDLATRSREYILLHTADLCEAWLIALHGHDITQIADWLAEGRLDTTRLLFPSVPLLHMTYGEVLLAQGRYTALIARETDERNLYRVYPTLLCELYLEIQLAAAYEQLEKREEALEHLRTAMKLAEPDKLWMPFAENSRWIADLLREEKDGPCGEIVEQILALFTDCYRVQSADPGEGFVQIPGQELTEREMDMAKLAAQGLTNKEIAAELYLSENTIKAGMRTVFSKLGITEETNKRKMLREIFGEN